MVDAQVGDTFRAGSSPILGASRMRAPRIDGQLVTDHRTFADGSREHAITTAVAYICDKRAIIEQVKGVLMCVYGIDADAAFEVLRGRSQETNVKLRKLAVQLMTDFCGETSEGGSGLSRSAVDRILLSVNERV
jgi:hypothetical protein